MANETEIERTFLAKYIPATVVDATFEDFTDIYIPFSAEHPKLRIRKHDSQYEMTKKIPVDEHSHSVHQEITILLTQEEYDELATINSKRITKRRYFFPDQAKIAEIDIFYGELQGLVLINFQFPDDRERDSFHPPDFCLAEVTEEDFIAGGMLAGKTYERIKPMLARYGYKPLSMTS